MGINGLVELTQKYLYNKRYLAPFHLELLNLNGNQMTEPKVLTGFFFHESFSGLFINLSKLYFQKLVNIDLII